MPEIILPLGNGWQQIGPFSRYLQPTQISLGNLYVSDGIPAGQIIPKPLAVGLSRKLESSPISKGYDEQPSPMLRNTKIGAIKNPRDRSILSPMAPIYSPKRPLDKRHPFSLTAKGEPRDILDHDSAREQLFSDSQHVHKR